MSASTGFLTSTVLALLVVIAVSPGTAMGFTTCNEDKPSCASYTCPGSGDAVSMDTCCYMEDIDDDGNIFDCDNACCDGAGGFWSGSNLTIIIVASVVGLFIIIPLCYCCFFSVACCVVCSNSNRKKTTTQTTTTTVAGSPPMHMPQQPPSESYPLKQQGNRSQVYLPPQPKHHQ